MLLIQKRKGKRGRNAGVDGGGRIVAVDGGGCSQRPAVLWGLR